MEVRKYFHTFFNLSLNLAIRRREWQTTLVFFQTEPYTNSVPLLSHVRLFATPWTTARQASLSITNSWSLLKLLSIESVMPSNHLILCLPLLLPSLFSDILLQFSSVTQSCPTLCDPMNHSRPGFPVHHQLPGFTQSHVH